MTLLSRSRSVNSPTSLPRSQTSAHPNRLAFIASTASRMLAPRSTIAGWRSGRRRILTSLNLSAIDIVYPPYRRRERVLGSLPLAALTLKIEAAMFENVVGYRFGGNDADGQPVSDDRHVAIFADGHFVDDHSDWVSFSDCFGALRHHFAHRQRVQVRLAPRDLVEQVA